MNFSLISSAGGRCCRAAIAVFATAVLSTGCAGGSYLPGPPGAEVAAGGSPSAQESVPATLTESAVAPEVARRAQGIISDPGARSSTNEVAAAASPSVVGSIPPSLSGSAVAPEVARLAQDFVSQDLDLGPDGVQLWTVDEIIAVLTHMAIDGLACRAGR